MIASILLFGAPMIATGQAAPDMPTKQTFVYKTAGDCRIKADLYRPDGPSILPVVFWIHGGALIAGDRNSIRKDQLDSYLHAGFAKRAIGEGRKVLIFPQGTRQAVGEPMKFQPAGMSALYTNLDIPVLPTAHNSGLFWGKKTLMIHSGDITLSYLPLIPPGLDRKEFQAKVERQISEEAGRLAKAADAKVAR